MRFHAISHKARPKLDAAIQLLKDFAVPTAALFALATWTPFTETPVELIPFSLMDALWRPLIWCLLCDAWFILLRFGIALLVACGDFGIALMESMGAIIDGSAGGAIGALVKGMRPLLIACIAAIAASLIWTLVESVCPEELKPMLSIAIGLACLACIVGPPVKVLVRDAATLATAWR